MIEVSVIGGQRRQVRVELDPTRLRAYSLSAFQIMSALRQANASLPSGAVQTGNTELLLQAGGFLENVDDVKSVVVGVHDGRPVFLQDVAKVSDGPEEPSNYVFMGLGPSANEKGIKAANSAPDFEAVTIAVSKKAGANASVDDEKAVNKAEALKGSVVPSGVNITTTRKARRQKRSPTSSSSTCS